MRKSKTEKFQKQFKFHKDIINKARKEMKKLASAYFKDAFGEIFKKYEGLKSVSWVMATDEWNDSGDYFKSFHLTPDINDEEEWEEWEDRADWTEEELEGDTNPDFPGRDEAVAEVKAFLAGFRDEDISTLFGDQNRVEITREGVKVTSYY